jgi:hypothetical protein
MSEIANLKAMGKKQRQFIETMLQHKDRFVQYVQYQNEHKQEFLVRDGDSNDWESLTLPFFQSLIDRRIILNSESFNATEHIVIGNYYLNHTISFDQ